ncbi:MAG TPA: hypothetical protein VGK73_18425 [Polyangiaceae bacterium]
MPWPVRSALIQAGLAFSLAAAPGRAEESAKPKAASASPGVRFEITEATTFLYAWDNRDFTPNNVASAVNDHFGVWYNRLNAQATSGGFRFGLRLDNAWYFTSPDATETALHLYETRPDSAGGLSDPAYFRLKLDETGRELSNRYINWIYPAKLWAGYAARDFDVTLGDFYAELGHGIVLSVRKRDELASDDTLRGVRANAHFRAGDARLGFSALGGSANPLRIDEGSGRYLGVHSSVTPGFLALTEAGMPRAVATDFVSEADECTDFGTCSYAPDRIAAGQFTLELGQFELGTQGSLLVRQAALSPDYVRSAERITTVSQTLELTTGDGAAAFALEAASQKLWQDDGAELPAGYAFYGTASLAFSPVVILVEAKHYRRLFPLLANVSVARAREFSQVAWSAPPTAEASYIDTEFDNFNTCVSGGRGRGDVELARGVSVFGWFGYFESFAESVPNDRCEIGESTRNRVYDVASGFEFRSRDSRSRDSLTAGARFDDTDAPIQTTYGETHAFYREVYTRYDLIHPLGGPFSLQLQGLHRYRRRTLGGPIDPWFEGEHVTGIDWGSAWSFALGVEYDTNPLPPDWFVNGGVRFRPTPESSVALFVGQRRGSLRCVGGVCRNVPGFEGARLDASIRF